MKQSKTKIIEELFFHEDDYLQVEIVPKENFFQKSKDIKLLEYSFDDLGINNISNRNNSKFPTSRLGIIKDELKFILEEQALVVFNKVRSGYGSNSKLRKNIFSFGYEDYTILFECNVDIVKNIWIVFNPKLKLPFHNYSNLTKALTKIGKKWNLILIDWNEEIIIDLKSEQKIFNYLGSL